MSSEKSYDVIIVGAGPAGMTSAIYASRARMNTLMIEKDSPGGQMTKTEEIENYPGYETILGPDLSHKMFEHAKKFDADYVRGDIKEIIEGYPLKTVVLKDKEYQANSIIVATGAKHRCMGIPGESEFSGYGVSYCAVCDGAFFDEQELVVIGGGDSAVEEAMFLTRFASKVTIIHRRDELRAQKIIQKRAFENEKINFIWNHTVEEIQGDGLVNGVLIKDRYSGETSVFSCNGIFIYIGMDPHTNCVKNLGITNEKGYIKVDEDMKTAVRGIFSVGDVNEKMLRQIITATGDGSIAALSAQNYVENLEEELKELEELEEPKVVQLGVQYDVAGY